MSIEAGDIEWRITADWTAVRGGLEASRTALLGFGGVVTGVLGKGVKDAGEFGGAMAEVASLGVKDLGGLEESVKDVSTEFGLGLTDAAKAAYQAISAGATEAQTPKLLADAAKAATAGVTDLTTSIELGTSVSNAYGKSLDNVNDIYDQAFIAVKNGVTTFDELSASVGKVSPTMAGLELQSDEMFASLAAITKGGINTAEAVTGLKAALSNIIKPTKDAQDVANELGIQFDTQSLQTLGLAGFMDMLKEKTGGNVDAMSALFGSTEALNVVLALTGNQNEAFNATLDEMRSGVAATDEAFRKIVENDPGFAWRQLKSELSVLSIEIGQALMPVLKDLLDIVKPMVQAVREWAQEHPELFSKILLVVGGLGLLSTAIGTVGFVMGPLIGLVTGAQGVVGAFGATCATTATGGVATLISSLAGPVGLGVAFVWTGTKVHEAINKVKEYYQVVAETKERIEDWKGEIKDQIAILEEHGVQVDKDKLQTISSTQGIVAAQEYLGKIIRETLENERAEREKTGVAADNTFQGITSSAEANANATAVAWEESSRRIQAALSQAAFAQNRLQSLQSQGDFSNFPAPNPQALSSFASAASASGAPGGLGSSVAPVSVTFTGDFNIRSQGDMDTLSRQLAGHITSQMRAAGYSF